MHSNGKEAQAVVQSDCSSECRSELRKQALDVVYSRRRPTPDLSTGEEFAQATFASESDIGKAVRTAHGIVEALSCDTTRRSWRRKAKFARNIVAQTPMDFVMSVVKRLLLGGWHAQKDAIGTDKTIQIEYGDRE